MNRKLCLSLFITFSIAFSIHTKAQIITTIAGNGIVGYSGDGSPATAAELSMPIGIATDNLGDIYFADDGNNVIRKINTSGIISTVAGNDTFGYSGDGGLATLAKLNMPWGITIDRSGNLYIADMQNNRIRKVDTSGIITTFAGCGICGFGGGIATATELQMPDGVKADNLGNVYVTEGNDVIKIDTSGIIHNIAGRLAPGYSGDNGPATDATLNSPLALCLDNRGNIYIADNNDRIRKINPSGIITTFAGSPGIGFHFYAGDCGPATAALLEVPFDVTTDNAGNVYIIDNGNFCIRKIDTAGIITTIAGRDSSGFAGDGGSAAMALFDNPSGFAIDVFGNMYITDRFNDNIRKITNFGSLKENCTATFTPEAVAIPAALTIYPNPNSGIFTVNISSPGNEQAQITIMNVLGEKVRELTAITNKLTGITLNEPPGVYLLCAATANNYWTRQLIINSGK